MSDQRDMHLFIAAFFALLMVPGWVMVIIGGPYAWLGCVSALLCMVCCVVRLALALRIGR